MIKTKRMTIRQVKGWLRTNPNAKLFIKSTTIFDDMHVVAKLTKTEAHKVLDQRPGTEINAFITLDGDIILGEVKYEG